jgi:hypothetical protein
MKTFFGGIPTAVDVKKLQEKWPVQEMNPGDIFLYSDVSALIKADIRSNRFKTVTNKWRRDLEHSDGVLIGTADSDKFVVLSDSQKLNLSGSKLRTAGRAVRRSIVVHAFTNRKKLTEAEQATYDHQQQVQAKIAAAAQLKRHQVGLPEW